MKRPDIEITVAEYAITNSVDMYNITHFTQNFLCSNVYNMMKFIYI